MSTRIVRPVDMPVSLAKGHIHTGPFRLNLRTQYWILVDPGQWWMNPTCDRYRLLTRWTLFQDRKVVAERDESAADGYYYLPTNDLAPGVYDLDLEVLSDTSCLNSGRPRLAVAAYTQNYETGAFILKALGVVCVVLGVYMLTFLPIVRLVGSREQISRVTDAVTVGQHFQWAQRLPLRRPFSGLPAFGLFAGPFFAFVVFVVIMNNGLGYHSKGLWVHLLKPGETPKKSDPWTEPLIVRLEDGGPGHEPKLLVNAKQVSWDDLDLALRQELGRRRDWVVYVEGDDCIPWSNVTAVIDLARGDHAKVFLLTENAGKDCGWSPLPGARQ